MNQTSTKTHNWQFDLEKFRDLGGNIQVSDVRAEDYARFLTLFCARHGYSFTIEGTTATLVPKTAGAPNSAPPKPQSE